MKLTVFRGEGQPNWMLTLDFSAGHGLTASAMIGTTSYLNFSAHNVTLEELISLRTQLGDAIAKAIQEDK